MTHAKFRFNRLMLTLIFGIRPLSAPRAWRTTEKTGPDRVKFAVIGDIGKNCLKFKVLCNRFAFISLFNLNGKTPTPPPLKETKDFN